MKKLRGVVMCGGQSKRMGTDKGLLPIANSCWAEHMGDKLKTADLPIAISINPSQLEVYQAVFKTAQLVLDSFNIGGPLNGLLSVHLKYPDDDLFLIACDMIDMKTETISHLVNAYHKLPGYDCYVYQNNNFAEPLCAIYKGHLLKNLIGGSMEVTLSNASLKNLLTESNTKRLPISEWDSFKNYNTQNKA